MADKQYIGIYLGGGGATVALIEPHGRVPKLHSCFRAAKPPAEGEKPVTLAEEVARVCAERQFAYESSALALDRGYYTQHRMRSQFSELARIDETVRFDAEEALTVDTSTLAVVFDLLRTDVAGSELNVYAADKKLLSDVLAELQAVGIDPVIFEPDAVALARFLSAILSQQDRDSAAWVLFTASSCTIVVYPHGQEAPHIRSFIVPASGATETLVREMTLTLASLKLSGALKALHVFDPQGRIDDSIVNKRLGLPVTQFDLVAASGWSPAFIEQGIEPLALAIACGEAMGDFTKDHKADFRHDFAPHLGRKKVIEKTTRAICLALTFIIFAFGLYLQLRVFGVSRARQALYQGFSVDYSAAMNTRKVPTFTAAGDKLAGELRNVKDRNQGVLSQESVAGLLTNMLEVVNSLPPSVDLQFDQIKVTPKNIVISGSTNTRDSTNAFLQKINATTTLSYSSVTQSFKNGRDEFGVTILPKRGRAAGASNAPKN